MGERCYVKPDLLALLHMSDRTFERLKAAGQLPYLEELRPRTGRIIRYRAAPVDRYLAGEWGQPRLLAGGRR